MFGDAHISDVILGLLIAIIGYFMRERDQKIQAIARELHQHLTTCVHVTPREKELSDQLMDERFAHIGDRIDALKDELRIDMTAIADSYLKKGSKDE